MRNSSLNSSLRKIVLAGLALGGSMLLNGCFTVGVAAHGPGYFNTSNCYWETVRDEYGYYERQVCWNPYYRSYQPYYRNGYYVRRYPRNYRGPRHRRPVRVSPPPRRGRRVDPPPSRGPRNPDRGRPGRRRPRPRSEAVQPMRKSVTIRLSSDALNRLDLTGSPFATSDVRTHDRAGAGKLFLEATVSGASEKEVDALIKELRSKSRINALNAEAVLGEGISTECRETSSGIEGACVESIDIIRPDRTKTRISVNGESV